MHKATGNRAHSHYTDGKYVRREYRQYSNSDDMPHDSRYKYRPLPLHIPESSTKWADGEIRNFCWKDSNDIKREQDWKDCVETERSDEEYASIIGDICCKLELEVKKFKQQIHDVKQQICTLVTCTHFPDTDYSMSQLEASTQELRQAFTGYLFGLRKIKYYTQLPQALKKHVSQIKLKRELQSTIDNITTTMLSDMLHEMAKEHQREHNMPDDEIPEYIQTLQSPTYVFSGSQLNIRREAERQIDVETETYERRLAELKSEMRETIIHKAVCVHCDFTMKQTPHAQCDLCKTRLL